MDHSANQENWTEFMQEMFPDYAGDPPILPEGQTEGISNSPFLDAADISMGDQAWMSNIETATPANTPQNHGDMTDIQRPALCGFPAIHSSLDPMGFNSNAHDFTLLTEKVELLQNSLKEISDKVGNLMRYYEKHLPWSLDMTSQLSLLAQQVVQLDSKVTQQAIQLDSKIQMMSLQETS